MSRIPDEAVQVAEAFAVVARSLAADDDVQATLDKIAHLAVEHLAACDCAGISVVERGRVTSAASSSDVPATLNRIESETGEGPCIDAIEEHEVFETGDLSVEDRWPAFAARAYHETGIRTAVALPLFVAQDTMGALNLYSEHPDAFDESDVALAAVFAAHAAVALKAGRRAAQLQAKASTRDIIGQAKGILMARSGVDEAEAFQLLKAASQRMNLKVRDVAEHVAEGRPLSDA